MTSAAVIVTCPDYTKEFKTQEAAERWIVAVENAGRCPHPHAIENRP